MPEKKTATKSPRTSAKSTGTTQKSGGITAGERAAMRELVRERKANLNREEAEREVLAKIAEMPKSDRVMAERIHAIVKETAPGLASRTWYGMPAYTKDDKVVCFFKSAHKFKTRYATLGFSDKANLDDGAMWPTDFALHEWTSKVESKIRRLVKRAVS